MYILIHIRLCGQVSGKKFFTQLISRNKTTFFWSNTQIDNVKKCEFCEFVSFSNTGSLRQYYTDQPNDNITESESFKNKI